MNLQGKSDEILMVDLNQILGLALSPSVQDCPDAVAQENDARYGVIASFTTIHIQDIQRCFSLLA